MFLRVVLRNDLGSNRMKPLVAIGVIEVPVRVHEVGDGVGAKIGKSLRQLGPRHGNTPVDQDFAVRASEYCDVPARTLLAR